MVYTKFNYEYCLMCGVLYIGIDTPGQEMYPPLKGALKLQAMNSREGMITEEREGEERLTSVPDRTHCELREREREKVRKLGIILY